MTVPELHGFQRKHLRSLAHPLKPLVHVGDEGISPGVLCAVDQALLDHELVKVRLHEPAEKKATARELAESTDSALCGLVGHTVILYRPHPDAPRIELPSSASRT
jgi:RNA-binding protein